MRTLVIAFFLSIPLLMTEYLRAEIGPVSLPLSVVLILVLSIVAFSANPWKFSRLDRSAGIVFALAGVLLLVHFNALLGASDITTGIKYVLRLVGSFATGVAVYLSVRNIPFVRAHFGKLLSVALILSTAILAYYIVQSAASGNPYLTANYDVDSGKGKNQFQIYLALIAPLAWYRLQNKWNLLWAGVFAIHALAVVYVGSRALYVAVIAGGLISAVGSGRIPKYISFRSMARWVKLSAAAVIALVVLAGGIMLASPRYTEFLTSNLEYMSTKVTKAVTDVEDRKRSGSVYERKYYATHAFKLFRKSPVSGSGLGNFELSNKYRKVSHNDYLFFLGDMGTLGLLAWLAFAISVLLVFHHARIPLYFVSIFLVDLLFINAYAFPLFWIVLGFALALKSEWKPTRTTTIPANATTQPALP